MMGAGRPLVALFVGPKSEVPRQRYRVPVIAFDDNGEPLVGFSGEAARPISSMRYGPEVRYVGIAIDQDIIVGVIPGGGWSVRLDGSDELHPVLAFGLSDNLATVVGWHIGKRGEVVDFTAGGNDPDCVLVPPGETPTP